MGIVERILLIVPVLLFSVVAHEVAHGWAALAQGDDTALKAGRLTLNPIKHIDPMLTIVMPLLLFLTTQMAVGGAKPVPVDPRKYRHYKRGDIIVSLAGVATNLVLAVVCAALTFLFGTVGRTTPSLAMPMAVLQAMFFIGAWLNLALIAFNLLPIPPLDGSHVFKYLLPPSWALHYQRLGFAGLILLVLLINTRAFAWWMAPVMSAVRALYTALERSGHLLPGLDRLLG